MFLLNYRDILKEDALANMILFSIAKWTYELWSFESPLSCGEPCPLQSARLCLQGHPWSQWCDQLTFICLILSWAAQNWLQWVVPIMGLTKCAQLTPHIHTATGISTAPKTTCPCNFSFLYTVVICDYTLPSLFPFTFWVSMTLVLWLERALLSLIMNEIYC